MTWAKAPGITIPVARLRPVALINTLQENLKVFFSFLFLLLDLAVELQQCISAARNSKFENNLNVLNVFGFS